MTELVVLVHQEDARVGEVVDVHELTTGGAGAPDDQFLLSFDLCLVKTSNQRSHHV
jgi:hypothetical protein